MSATKSTSSEFATYIPIICDGGFASWAETGHGQTFSTDLWSAELLESDPSMVTVVHTDYVLAGARCITTNTYQAHVPGLLALLPQGSDASAAEGVISSAAQLARDAAMTPHAGSTAPLVAGSIGPYGAAMHDGSEYTGAYARALPASQLHTLAAWMASHAFDPTAASAQPERVGIPGLPAACKLAAWHAPRIRALAPACDVLAVETMPCAVDALSAAWVARSLAKHTPLWVSCQVGQAGLALPSGEALADVAQALRMLLGAQAVAIGVNCCHPAAVTPALAVLRGPCAAPVGCSERHLRAVLRCIQSGTDPELDPDAARWLAVPRVIAYPNAGEQWDADAGAWLPRSRQLHGGNAVAWLATWQAAGVDMIGGCCRVDPSIVQQWREHVGASGAVDEAQ